jgi:prephenate dehydratase
MEQRKLKLGSLGGPNTFGGEAAQRTLELYPMFTEIVYFPTSEDAQRFEGSDASCAPQQTSRTGHHSRTQVRVARYGSQICVLAEVTHAYHCSLLVKPGADEARIMRVIGHTGSVTQCRDWITANLPQARIEIVDTSSMGAAAEVASSDGSTASIGTPGMAGEFGLEERHKDIDGHSVGAYWTLSKHQLFSESPTRLVVAGRFKDDGRLSGLIGALAGAGFGLASVFSMASGQRLSEYDYALQLSGAGSLSAVRSALSGFGEARLAGAFVYPSTQ